jgi:ABC-type transport system involved in cytochrome c biogenesis ATPase subunit
MHRRECDWNERPTLRALSAALRTSTSLKLSRVVYARADLVLLDDVLAAVDSHVAKHIFSKCL